MRTKLSHILYSLFVVSMFGCSIDVAQPVVPTPSLEFGPVPPTLSTVNGAPSASSTTIPVTWAGMSLTGSLLYASASLTDVTPINIQRLDLVTGEIDTLFTTTGDAWVYYMTVSPDGKQLVMSYAPPSDSAVPSSRALYTMPIDGTTPPQLLFQPPTPDDHYIHVEWSPDGKYIYYVHYNNQDRTQGDLYPAYDMFRMHYPDGQPEKVAEKAFWPRLSADSTRLAYVALDPASGTNELFVANADGTNPQKITLSGPTIPGIIDAPIFSPDGTSILFSAPPPAQAYQPNWLDELLGIQVAKAHSIPSDWWSVPVTGGELTRLTQIQTINLFASISPDQSRIASVSGEGLFVMGWDGSNLTQLLFNPGVSGTVSWLP